MRKDQALFGEPSAKGNGLDLKRFGFEFREENLGAAKKLGKAYQS